MSLAPLATLRYRCGPLAFGSHTQVSPIGMRDRTRATTHPHWERTPAYRRYFGDYVRRLRFARSARNLGLSLAEISELVKREREHDATTRGERKPRIAKLHQRLMELQEWRKDLADWLHGAKLDTDEIASKFPALTESMLAVIAGERLDPQLCPGGTGGCLMDLAVEAEATQFSRRSESYRC